MKAREHALKVMQRIIALKVELRALESELDAILPSKDDMIVEPPRRAVNGMVPAQPQESLEPITNGNGTAANLLDRILDLITTNPTASFSAEQVCNRLNLSPDLKHSVRSTLWNLTQKSRIRKIKRGEFGALMQEESKNDGLNPSG